MGNFGLSSSDLGFYLLLTGNPSFLWFGLDNILGSIIEMKEE